MVFAVTVVLISEVFFQDDTVYVNYSTVCEQFRSEMSAPLSMTTGVLTLEHRTSPIRTRRIPSATAVDLGLFYEDLGTLILGEQQEAVSAVL